VREQQYRSVEELVSDVSTIVTGWRLALEPTADLLRDVNILATRLNSLQLRLKREQRGVTVNPLYLTSPLAPSTSRRRSTRLEPTLGLSHCSACGNELLVTPETHGNDDTADAREWLCRKCLEGQRSDLLIGRRFWSYWKLDKTWYPGTLTAFIPKAKKFYLGYDDGDWEFGQLDDDVMPILFGELKPTRHPNGHKIRP